MSVVPCPCGLLLSCACIVCGGETCPGGERGIIAPDGHIRPYLAQDIEGGFFGNPDHCGQVPDDAGVFLTEIIQFFINDADTFVDPAKVQVYDPKLVLLDANEFIAVDTVEDSLCLLDF